MTKLLLRLFVKNYRNTDDPKVRGAYGRLAGLVGLVCNLLLFAGKLVAGTLAGSVSVTADAVNNLSDASSSLVTLFGFKLAERPADEEHPYGHARMEYLSGLLVAVLILVIGVELAKSSVEKILHPEAVEFSVLTLCVLIASILVKLWMCLFCKKTGQGHRLHRAGGNRGRQPQRRDYNLGGASGTACRPFFRWRIDGWVGALVAVFILLSGWSIAKETISPLLGKQADRELVRRISDLVLGHPKILGIHDLMVHDYGPGQCFATVHVEMDMHENPLVCHDILDDIERDALRELHVHLVIHYDPVVTDDVELNHMRALVEKKLKQLDPRLSMHDFRMVRGPQHTNLIFDLAVPFDLSGKTAELKRRIDECVQFEDHKYYTVITFDPAMQPES